MTINDTMRRYRSRRLQERAALNLRADEEPEAVVLPSWSGPDPRFQRPAGRVEADSGRFAAVLRSARNECGLSQVQLGLLAGFDHSYVSRLESDTRSPTRDAVLKLARALGCDEQERDGLLAAAGFLPIKIEHLLESEPEVGRVWEALHRGDVPGHVKQIIRIHLSEAANQADRWLMIEGRETVGD